MTFKLSGDAPAETLRELLAQAQRRSAVFDMVSHGVPVSVTSIIDQASQEGPNGAAD